MAADSQTAAFRVGDRVSVLTRFLDAKGSKGKQRWSVQRHGDQAETTEVRDGGQQARDRSGVVRFDSDDENDSKGDDALLHSTSCVREPCVRFLFSKKEPPK